MLYTIVYYINICYAVCVHVVYCVVCAYPSVVYVCYVYIVAVGYIVDDMLDG